MRFSGSTCPITIFWHCETKCLQKRNYARSFVENAKIFRKGYSPMVMLTLASDTDLGRSRLVFLMWRSNTDTNLHWVSFKKQRGKNVIRRHCDCHEDMKKFFKFWRIALTFTTWTISLSVDYGLWMHRIFEKRAEIHILQEYCKIRAST